MVLKPYEMTSLSMSPDLLPGDVLLVDVARSKPSLRKGEVVVFRESSNAISTSHRFLDSTTPLSAW